MNLVDWCRMNDIWYLKIDADIPEIVKKEAQTVFDEGFFVPHRDSNGVGWWSSSLHGWAPKDERDASQGWRYTMNPSGYGYDEKDVNWGWTDMQEYAPEMKRWLEDFPNKGYRRCRFMMLQPDGGIIKHHDADERRIADGKQRNLASAINIAIHQPKDCYLRRADTKEELPFKDCTGFWFDNGVEHEALNSSNENRFHFIIHGGMNTERKRLMMQSLVKEYGSDILKEIDD
jgi:hypothetical protein